ncbi:uncharacterized protein [Atheta coriaria]|uniref:uncharacterized protein n=1 Tax=Dalotia coriaria TaxID=877792 RepID=UPI0031F42445
MEKSVINVLQEHCITRFKKYPEYLTRDTSKGNSPLFTVECVIENVRSAGIASSKIAAKTDAAEQMLRKLGISKSNNMTASNYSSTTYTSPPRTNENYVGTLNEYCSKNNYVYPNYSEGMDGSTFRTICRHQSLVTEGRGSNKKIAKQESARAMIELCHDKTKTSSTNSGNKVICNNLSALSLQDFCNPKCQPSQPIITSTPNKQSSIKPFALSNQTDSVSALNLYCDKYKYKKPEYFDIGKEGNVYTTKCVYQSFMTRGTGLTTKFAKQDSARQMLEIIGVRKPDDKPTVQEVNLIDMNDNINHPIQPAKPQLLDKEVIEIYNKTTPIKHLQKTETNDIEELMSFFAAKNEEPNCENPQTHAHLRQILVDNKVKYEIEVLQNHDPCIMILKGKRLMNDGKILDRNLMDMGDRRQEIIGNLLTKAIASFECKQL